MIRNERNGRINYKFTYTEVTPDIKAELVRGLLFGACHHALKLNEDYSPKTSINEWKKVKAEVGSILESISDKAFIYTPV